MISTEDDAALTELAIQAQPVFHAGQTVMLTIGSDPILMGVVNLAFEGECHRVRVVESYHPNIKPGQLLTVDAPVEVEHVGTPQENYL